MRRGLIFKNSPALSVPLRFFLSVPLFALLAAALLMWAGPDAFNSRWSPVTLALTHLLTLGVLASAMIGALLQILPVATNVNALFPKLTAAIVHTLLTLGTLVLVAAFLLTKPLLFQLAMVLLLAALLWLVLTISLGLWRHRFAAAPQSANELQAIRLAITALFLTAGLGASLATALGWQLNAPLLLLTHLHSIWGLLGWVGLLVMGVSFQVIPIFLVTELYPAYLTRWLTPTIFGLLALWTLSMVYAAQYTAITHAIELLLMLVYVLYAASTFYLLWKRKRPVADATTLFWRLAMLSLAASGLLWLAALFSDTDLSVTLGVLFIVGFAWSAINGMLYKILPFLLWYHTQKDLQVALRIVPKVKQIIPDTVAIAQFKVHALGISLLIAATLWPALIRPAAIVMAVSAAWLGMNIIKALVLYVNAKKAIALALKTTQPINI